MCLPQLNEKSLGKLHICRWLDYKTNVFLHFFSLFLTFYHFFSLFLTFETFLAKKSLLKTPPDLRPPWDTNTLQFSERGRTRWMNHQDVAGVTPVLQPGRKGKVSRRGQGGDLQGQACGARMCRMRMKVVTSMPDKMTDVPPGHT